MKNRRAAWEVIREIAVEYRKLSRVMISAWSQEHIRWLIDRWLFKKPGDAAAIAEFDAWLKECVTYRICNGVPNAKVFVHIAWIRKLLEGSEVIHDIIQPPATSSSRRTGVFGKWQERSEMRHIVIPLKNRAVDCASAGA